MTAPSNLDSPAPTGTRLSDVVAQIADQADDLDARPRFPAAAFTDLIDSGATTFGLDPGEPVGPTGFRAQCALVREVSAADSSVGRILDGHLNAVERILLHADPATAATWWERAGGGALLGLWGADPVDGEGPAARLFGRGEELTLDGVKVFCSGAGGLDAALVLCRRDGEQGPPRLVLVGARDDVRVDPAWFKGSGMRASESHRVTFVHAPVLAELGGPGVLGEAPWLHRDAIRTAHTWAGSLDALAAAALASLAQRPPDPRADLAAGAIGAACDTADLWLAQALRAVDDHDPAAIARASIHGRWTIAAAARTVIAETEAAAGSRPFATTRALDRPRRDLQLFLSQHRLEPLLSRAGAVELAGLRADADLPQ
ncbi:MAG: hypothetical protein ACR2NA_08180 [Solirubrobacterales bacterium]